MSCPPDPADALPQTWEAWLGSHGPRFLLFARQQTRCAADAEDILQEALVETWRRAGGRPETALVFATIRRRAIDLARRTGRRLLREETAAADLSTGSPSPWFSQGPDLEEALRHLPEPQREIITLRIWGGLTVAESAAALGIPQGTAASRYRLALENLRHTLTASAPPLFPPASSALQPSDLSSSGSLLSAASHLLP